MNMLQKYRIEFDSLFDKIEDKLILNLLIDNSNDLSIRPFITIGENGHLFENIEEDPHKIEGFLDLYTLFPNFTENYPGFRDIFNQFIISIPNLNGKELNDLFRNSVAKSYSKKNKIKIINALPSQSEDYRGFYVIFEITVDGKKQTRAEKRVLWRKLELFNSLYKNTNNKL